MCMRVANRERANPATPAKAIWASDVWPPKPVRITRESANTTAMVVVMIAPRQSGPRNNSPAMASPGGANTVRGVILARGTAGSFQLSTAPRSGSRSPSATMATMITMNGNPSRAPYSGNQPKLACSFVKTDWIIPIAIPTATVGMGFLNSPMRAAPTAGIR